MENIPFSQITNAYHCRVFRIAEVLRGCAIGARYKFLQQVAKHHFLSKTDGKASFLRENRWLSLVFWGKQVAEPHFVGKTGARVSFLGENRWLSLVS